MRILEETEFGTQVVALLTEHLEQMAAESPAESMHALALDDLQSDDITVWSMWSPGYCGDAVSYTHLTLPTILRV